MSNLLLGPDGLPLSGRGPVDARVRATRAWQEVYESADRRDFRGYFYFPTLKPEEQLSEMTLQAIWERTEWLLKNVPAVGMAIDSVCHDEVGTGLWPVWTSGNAAYNKRVTEAYHQAVKDPRVFSADGESDGYTAQYNIRRMIRIHGDGFGQMLRPAPGSIHPQLSLIPGYRVGSNGKEKAGDGWVNGVRKNRLGRSTEFRVLGAKPEDSVDVPAEDMLHFHDPFLPGQVRGEPVLASVAKKMFRREDIAKAIANGTLLRERLGFAIEYSDATQPRFGDLGGEEGERSTVENEDGSKFSLQKAFGENAPDRIAAPDLPPGASIKMLESNRPGTAVMDYLDAILRELAWALRYPPEYIFFLANMGQGTVARLVLQKVQRLVKARRAQQLVPQFCNRWHVYHAWMMIRAGMFDDVGVPVDWWRHKVQSDGDLSVDIGREGSLYDRRVSTGKMSVESYHAMNGEDASDVEDENLDAMSRRMEKLRAFNEKNGTTMTYFDVWPRETTMAVSPAAQTTTQEEA